MSSGAKKWRRAFGLLAGMAHTNATKVRLYITEDKMGTSLCHMPHSSFSKLELRGCQLEKLPLGMGALLTNLGSVILDRIPPPAASPTEKERAKATPCANVKELIMRTPLASRTALDWTRLFFPNITKLTASIGALPIKTHEDAGAHRGEYLEMEEISDLALSGDLTTVCPLFENLKLFPNLRSITFGHIVPIPHAILADSRGADVAFPYVKSIKACLFPVNLVFLERLPRIFPFLEELFVSGASFRSMVRSGQEGAPATSFGSLKKLTISFDLDPGVTAIPFGGFLGSMCPSLSEIEMIGRGCVEPSPIPEVIKPMKKVKAVAVFNGNAHCLPAIFMLLFPDLESLSMVSCKLHSLSSCAFASDMDRCSPFFYAHLRRLDISGNPGLNKILEGMEPAQLRTLVNPRSAEYVNHNSPPSLSSMAYCKAVSFIRPSEETLSHVIKTRHIPPAGGLHLPKLEFVDVRGSFYDRLPWYFFNGCPRIKTLRISFNPGHAENSSAWWDCLEALSELETLDVEIGSFHSLKKKYRVFRSQGFSGNTIRDIFKDLRTTLTKISDSRPAPFEVRFFRPGSSAPITVNDLPLTALQTVKHTSKSLRRLASRAFRRVGRYPPRAAANTREVL